MNHSCMCDFSHSRFRWSLVLALLIPGIHAISEDAFWRDIAGHFQPPPEFENRLGEYRSPLLSKDGTPVSKADWAGRRREILEDWHGMLGAWPPLIEKPRIEVLESIKREGFTQHRVRVEIASDQQGDGYLLVPEGSGPFPAVIVPYYEPESSIGMGAPLRDFGLQLANRGFVTLSIGSPGGSARDPETGTAKCQPLSFLAYIAANCANALAQLPNVDEARLGIVGHSYGGKWAMFASCLYDKFACAAWSDPGIVFDETRPNVNYWEPWYLGKDPAFERKPGVPTVDNPRTGPYKLLREANRDLHELHALMAPRPFLVSGGSEDPPERWVALNHSREVNQLLGYTDRVAMTNRPQHPPTAESNEQIYKFFEWFLKPSSSGRGTAEDGSGTN